MTRTIEHLTRLVAMPTVSADSNLALVDYLEATLKDVGAAVHRVVDAGGSKAGLFARIGPASDNGILLSGHTDVVPVAGQTWSSDPFRLRSEAGRLYGRGTADMKGFLAAMLTAAEKAAAVPLASPLLLAFSWDEEVGCLGLPQMLPRMRQLIGNPRLCIVGEPTGMQIATGHKGKMAFRATCHGRGGHSAMAPIYLNALHLAAEFMQALREMQDRLAQSGRREPGYDIPYATVHVGRITGGGPLNIVPDIAVIDAEIRHPQSEPLADLWQEVRQLAEEVAAASRSRFPEARVELDVTNAYPGLGVAADAPEVGILQSLLPQADLIKVAYGTEAGYFHQAGVPSLVCGPGHMAQGHKPDEYVEETQLARCDAFLGRVIDRLRR